MGLEDTVLMNWIRNILTILEAFSSVTVWKRWNSVNTTGRQELDEKRLHLSTVTMIKLRTIMRTAVDYTMAFERV
jgi:hypothetical protein